MPLAQNNQSASAAPSVDRSPTSQSGAVHAEPSLSMKLSGQMPGRSRPLGPKTAAPLDAEVQEQLTALFQHGQFQQAAARCVELLNAERKNAFLWELLGRCHLAQNALDEAATCLNKACELKPTSAMTFAAMGEVYKRQNRPQDAIALYRKALSLDETCLPALNNLGNSLLEQGQIAEADQCFAQAIEQAPDNAQLLYNRANIQRQLGNDDVAISLFNQAARFAPNFQEARYNLAQMLANSGKPKEAIYHLEQILLARPAEDRARALKLRLMAEIADWSWVGEYAEHRRTLGLRGTACSPRALIMLEDNPDLLRIRMQAHASTVAAEDATALVDLSLPRPAQIRIGYFITSGTDSAANDQLARLLANHDQSRFAIYTYFAGPAAKNTTAIQHHDLRHQQPHAIREQVLADQLDIAINITSAEQDPNSALFAHRLAPIQIAMPGFPSTLGNLSHDYLLADTTNCPAGSERHFEEHLIRMPDAYTCGETTDRMSGQQHSRRKCGLPDDAFVFCALAKPDAITPAEFDLWMPLLQQIEDSVLWMPNCGPDAQENLRSEAVARGVAADRLIFATAENEGDPMTMLDLADLALDSLTVNAANSTLTALSAGLPVLTLPGRQMAARTSASLLEAAGLDTLVAKSASDYRDLAKSMAQDRDQLMSLRGKLRMSHSKAPIFDSAKYTTDLERAYDMLHAHHAQNLPAQHLTVPSEDHGFIPGAVMSDAVTPAAHPVQVA
ncbi:tetratricopeptide repeat protein [Phaeobacter sp.]|uniref:O-linked N-acetylglucosamine transferase, SPINDLY family protein n=1 Tax=Phaeobacter sp. TaxID=1902409 RepID=UPI0025DE66AE|nr:tetratricopeptide repeat protein [Phaeobacter sp.]